MTRARTAALLLRALLALLASVIAAPVQAQPAQPVYYLAIGSSRFLPPTDPNDHGFPELLGARNGANTLAQLLTEGGARFGITLTSPEGAIVGKKDIDAALDAILARIEKDRRPGQTPLLIVYIAAHGISDGFSWNQFSVPGDLTYRGEPEELSVVELADMAVHAATLVDRLDKAKLRYMLIVDTCYEGTPSRFDSPVLSSTAQGNIADISSALRFRNEFHQGNPVLFSVEPGKKVKVAPDPDDPTHNSMGPLARRLVLHIEAARAKGRDVTSASMIAALTDPDGDPITKPAITHTERAGWWDMPVIRIGAAPGEIEDREGTATTPQLCCLAEAIRAAAAPKPVSALGSVSLRSAAGESILNGRTLMLTKDITVTFTDPQTIEVAAADSDGDWSFEFTAPKPLAVGRYAGATRSPFQDDGRNGMSVSGHSSACNELRGEFEILSMPGAGGGKLTLRFTQYCDDDKAPLSGAIEATVGR